MLRSVHSTSRVASPPQVGTSPRLLLILTEFPPRVGGMQTHALYLSHHLARRGYPVEVITYQPADAEEREAVRGFDACLPFRVRRVLSRMGFWHNLDVLSTLAARFRPDLVYASTVFYGLLGHRLGVPVVCRSVGNDVLRPWIAYPFRPGSRVVSTSWFEDRLYRLFHRFKHSEWIEALFREARWRLMQRSAQEAALVLANSEFTANLLRSIGVLPERIETVVGGVDAARFARPHADASLVRRELGLPLERYIITTACRLEAKKGVDFLLEAFARLCLQVPDAHLAVVGDGRQGEYYRWLAESMGLGDRVTFTGRVPHQEVHAYYWATDLFVLASREHVNPVTGQRDVETMGRVLCEANAAGVPVVAARSGGIPSVITHNENGLLFEPGDADDLLAQVALLRRNRALAAQLVRKGREVAWERFEWSVVMAAHERAFARTLGWPVADTESSRESAAGERTDIPLDAAAGS